MIVLSVEKPYKSVVEFVEDAIARGDKIIVTDRESIKLLRETGVLKRWRGIELIVLNKRCPEEDSLRLITLYTPVEAFICDQRGTLNVLSTLLTRLNIPLRECDG
ncbi:hypothetical protein [Desulfurococcus amylolyticus]|uniref:Uncharacterized protein n=1 Tax=Desulfurococcus amylolyticus DSM 16532 TaxID=768672 RepID=I3XQ02_DESAM|nr:hypothetical protein [Desulfurococcus amylolyticus]AFL66026.1 hypothetical protein Desfe_0113 [Desulfurococcus amylolyticus DSM 16532]